MINRVEENGQATAKRLYKRLDFSLEQEETLIDFVKSNAPLFNPKDAHYKNKMFRDRLWSEIGESLNKPGMILQPSNCFFHISSFKHC